MPYAQTDIRNFGTAPGPESAGNGSPVTPGGDQSHPDRRLAPAARLIALPAAVVTAVLGPLVKLVYWLRAGYPVQTPYGHVALLALAPCRSRQPTNLFSGAAPNHPDRARE